MKKWSCKSGWAIGPALVILPSLLGHCHAEGMGRASANQQSYRNWLPIIPRSSSSLVCTSLRCEYLVNPLGLAEESPRLSWKLNSPERGQRQTAYRLLVATTLEILNRDQGDLWDSDKVSSQETTAVVYAGKPLSPFQICHWKVKVWDRDGQPSAWSLPAHWSMGPLAGKAWAGSWIGYDKHRPVPTGGAALAFPTLYPPVYLRTAFRVDKSISRAELSATALGLLDVHLNGGRVSEDRLNPGWTDYAIRTYYRTYDVSARIRLGENVLGAVLADGWYSGYVGYNEARNHYGIKPRIRVLLRLQYSDGTSEEIVTNGSWKASLGPLREADLLMGESYDATRSINGWDGPGFDAANWDPVSTGAEVNPVLQPHPGPPIKTIAEFRPVSFAEPVQGAYVFDLGQNFAGVARIRVIGQAGDLLTLRHGERLNPDGTIYTENLRDARATDYYVCSGTGVETWEPRFTYHGFQYLELRGLREKPTLDTVTGIAIGSDTPVAGDFVSSSSLLNQLYKNAYWTQRSNYMDIPTDCPQRDERLGWTGDVQIFIRTAVLNADIQTFMSKWLTDLVDAQNAMGQFPEVAPLKVGTGDGSPGWSDAGVIVPWAMYEAYGDRRLLARQYPSIKKFIEFCRKRSPIFGASPPVLYPSYGDWLNYNAETSKDLINTAYFAHSVSLAAQIADVLGQTADATQYRAMFNRIKESFNAEFFGGAEDRILGDTQTAYVLALAFDLVDGARAQRSAQYLISNLEQRNWHVTTGFLGVRDLMQVLSKIGRHDVGYRLLQTESFPSWGYSIAYGATSIWERWDSWTADRGFQNPTMNSFSHTVFGAVCRWMIDTIAGIRSENAGYERILLVPEIGGGLSWARAVYSSLRGEIRSEWRIADGQLQVNVSIPANAEATLYLPATDVQSVTESSLPLNQANGVQFLRTEGGKMVLAVNSGQYRFLMPQP